jgi:hypothetical protein
MTAPNLFGKADFAIASAKIKEPHTSFIFKFGMWHIYICPTTTASY